MTGLYIILDADTSGSRGLTLPDLARLCAGAGARLFQVRDKHASGESLLAVTRSVMAALAETDSEAVTIEWRRRPRRWNRARTVVIVNDRADVAACAGASGVHLGQDDLPPAASRLVLATDAIVGRSTHTRAQIDAALDEPISYLAVGPVFATATKATGYEPVGLDLVQYAARRAGNLPVVAIGGITLERAASAQQAGASAVAIISDLFASPDIEARVREYVAILAARA